MKIHRLVTGKWKENCYLVEGKNRQCLIIDPGDEGELIIDTLREKNLKPLAILNTHAHYDHIGAVAMLKEHFGIPFYLHSQDKDLLRQANLYRMAFEGVSSIKIPKVDYFFDQIQSPLRINDFKIIIYDTPGHTPGGVSIQIENILFTGDILLKQKMGRSDLPGGNEAQLKNSLLWLARLSPQLTLYPGHGEAITTNDP